jgi:hypothetical protein
MIKRYNQFVNEKVNEDLMGGTEGTPTRRETETPTRERERPTRRGTEVIPDDVPSEEPNPLAKYTNNWEDDEEVEEVEVEEEEEEDIYSRRLKELAKALGLEEDAVQNNRLEFDGKEIIFPSETEKFHVDRKKFDTVEQVVDYLKNEKPTPKLAEEDRIDPEFEAKSYKFSRREKRLK